MLQWLIQTDPIPYDQLLGPYGLLVFLIIAVWVMGRVLFRYIRKLEEDRDYWRNKTVDLLETSANAVNAAVRLSPEKDIRDMARVVDEARRRGDL